MRQERASAVVPHWVVIDGLLKWARRAYNPPLDGVRIPVWFWNELSFARSTNSMHTFDARPPDRKISHTHTQKKILRKSTSPSSSRRIPTYMPTNTFPHQNISSYKHQPSPPRPTLQGGLVHLPRSACLRARSSRMTAALFICSFFLTAYALACDIPGASASSDSALTSACSAAILAFASATPC